MTEPRYPLPPQHLAIVRTYPQPDSPAANIGPRERALATYKYLLNMEPEQAHRHQLFPTMVHAFEQARDVGYNQAIQERRAGVHPTERVLGDSLTPLLTSHTPATVRPA